MKVAENNNIEAAEVVFPVAGFDSPFLPKTIDKNPATVKAKDIAGVSRQAYLQRDLGIVDQSTRMNHLVVRIDDPYSLNSTAPQLKFGTYVEVEFAGKLIPNVYKVPQNLVNKRKIWIIDSEQKLLSKDVEVVREEGTYFLISKGISEQDRVVMTLPEYPQNGMGVKLLSDDGDKVAASDK